MTTNRLHAVKVANDITTPAYWTTDTPRYRIVNTWNGGKGGRVVVYESTERGSRGHDQCFVWIHHNTPFSYNEAVTHQGYLVEPITEVQS